MRLHAGLVCIDAPFGLNLDLQRQIFAMILEELAKNGDLINQVLQVDIRKDGRVELERFAPRKTRLITTKELFSSQGASSGHTRPNLEQSLIRV